jgi:hypothetical protein
MFSSELSAPETSPFTVRRRRAAYQYRICIRVSFSVANRRQIKRENARTMFGVGLVFALCIYEPVAMVLTCRYRIKDATTGRHLEQQARAVNLAGRWLVRKPTPAEAEQAMTEMLVAVRTTNCRTDHALEKVPADE